MRSPCLLLTLCECSLTSHITSSGLCTSVSVHNSRRGTYGRQKSTTPSFRILNVTLLIFTAPPPLGWFILIVAAVKGLPVAHQRSLTDGSLVTGGRWRTYRQHISAGILAIKGAREWWRERKNREREEEAVQRVASRHVETNGGDLSSPLPSLYIISVADLTPLLVLLYVKGPSIDYIPVFIPNLNKLILSPEPS